MRHDMYCCRCLCYRCARDVQHIVQYSCCSEIVAVQLLQRDFSCAIVAVYFLVCNCCSVVFGVQLLPHAAVFEYEDLHVLTKSFLILHQLNLVINLSLNDISHNDQFCGRLEGMMLGIIVMMLSLANMMKNLLKYIFQTLFL